MTSNVIAWTSTVMMTPDGAARVEGSTSPLGRRPFDNNEKVEMTVREWLRMQEPNFYDNEIFKLVPS